MAISRLPNVSKIWQLDVNIVAATGGTTLANDQNTFFAIKNSLVSFSSNPWIVISSSDSVTADSSDNWTVSTDLIWSFGNHSWIVLEKPTTGSQLLLSLDRSTSSTFVASWSPGGLYTGGSISVDPTATDQVTISSFSQWNGGLTSYSSWVHVWHSSDGARTRIVVSNDSANTLRLFWILDEIEDPFPDNWNNPEVVMIYTSTTNAIDRDILSNSPVNSTVAKGYDGTSSFDVYVYSQGYSSAGAGFDNWFLERPAGTVGNELQSSPGFPISPIGVLSDTTGTRGIHGVLTDLWFGHEDRANGSTYPNSTTNKLLAQAAEVIFPWTGDDEIPLFAGGSTAETTIDGTFIGYGSTNAATTISQNFLMIAEDSGAPMGQKPFYVTWKVVGSPDSDASEAPTPPFGGPLINVAVTAQYEGL